jgi:hypothetical protein
VRVCVRKGECVLVYVSICVWVSQNFFCMVELVKKVLSSQVGEKL